MKTMLFTLVLILAAACATIPPQLEGSYSDVTPARVDPGLYGSPVRWGGVIIDTRNEENLSCFEVLSRELDRYLRPRPADRTFGRFIACKAGFHDPEVYAKGREITLTGRISDIQVRAIDEFDYRYPVVEVDSLVLWEERQDVLMMDHFDPFYYPFYWHYGPYWGHYPFYPYYRYSGPYSRARVYKSLPDPAETSDAD